MSNHFILSCFFDSCTITCIIAMYCLYRVSTLFFLEFMLYQYFLYTSTIVTASIIRLFMFIIFVNVKHDEDTTNSFTLGLFWGMILSNLGQGIRHSINYSLNLACKNYIFVCLHACECHVISTMSMIWLKYDLQHSIVHIFRDIYIYIHNV